MKKSTRRITAVLLALALVLCLMSVMVYAEDYSDWVVNSYNSPGGWTGPMVVSNNELIPRPYFGGEIQDNKVALKFNSTGVNNVYKLDVRVMSGMESIYTDLTFNFDSTALQMCKPDGTVSSSKEDVFEVAKIGDTFPGNLYQNDSVTARLLDPAIYDGTLGQSGNNDGNLWSNTYGNFAFSYKAKASVANALKPYVGQEGSIIIPSGGLAIGSVYFKLKDGKSLSNLNNNSFKLDNVRSQQLFSNRSQAQYAKARTGADLTAVYYSNPNATEEEILSANAVKFLCYAMDLEVTSNVLGTSSSFEHKDTHSSKQPEISNQLTASDIVLTSTKYNGTKQRIQGESTQPVLTSNKPGYNGSTSDLSINGNKIYVSAYKKTTDSTWTYTHDSGGNTANADRPLPRSLPVGEYQLKVCVAGNVNFHSSEMILLNDTFDIVNTPEITGQTTLNLIEGYTAQSTEVYTITGYPAPTVTKQSGNNAITWNNSTKKLDIATGLAVGNYPVVLSASNSIGSNASITFTLTITADVATAKTAKIATVNAVTNGLNSADYTTESWQVLQTSITNATAQVNTATTIEAVNAVATPTTAGLVRIYTLTVSNGSGSGKYVAGTTVTITANSAPSGKVFDKWTSTAGTIANINNASTTFTMPASAATVKATYKDDPAVLLANAKTAKIAAINAVTNGLNSTDYTTESWQALQTAITNAIAQVNAATTISAVNAVVLPSTAGLVRVYTLTVHNGSGSGKYAAGATVNITANAPNGKVFDKWTATGVTLANPNSANANFTMPANAVTVTANFKDAGVVDTTKYIRLWGKTTKYVSNFGNWLLCIFLFGWIWMAF